MIWALDQVDQSSKSLQYPEDWSDEEISLSEDMIADEEVKGVCYTTKCGESCRKGDHEASQMNGQPGLSTMDRCPKNKFRRLCCNKGTTMGKCRWRGYRGLGLACTGGCADLETEITQNTNHHSDKEDQTCSGGTQSYCCAGFMPPISKEQMEEKIKDEAADAAIAAAEALALEVAAKAFCRIAITAALTPLTFIPIVGKFNSLLSLRRICFSAEVPTNNSALRQAGSSVLQFRLPFLHLPTSVPRASSRAASLSSSSEARTTTSSWISHSPPKTTAATEASQTRRTRRTATAT